MTHTFQQFKSIKSWLDYRVMEHQSLMGLLYIQECKPDIENKEEICKQLHESAQEAHRNSIEQRELFYGVSPFIRHQI